MKSLLRNPFRVIRVRRSLGAGPVVRATDGTGQLQPETFNLPQPNGGSGWHSIDVKVTAA